MKTICFLFSLWFTIPSFSQDLAATIYKALTRLESDEQFRHSVISMYVVDSKTGRVLITKNAQTGMAPASCQKVLTSASAFELLGKHYRYRTLIGTDSTYSGQELNGNLIIKGYGDPTLGSWRWQATRADVILKQVADVLRKKDIRTIKGGLFIDDGQYAFQPVPDGWIWQDIGNYYGAGAWGFNWKENQYDLHLRSGPTGSLTTVLSTEPVALESSIHNMIRSGRKGSGDNGYIYAAPFGDKIFTTGTIPPNEKDFSISGSLPDPPMTFAKYLNNYLKRNNITIQKEPATHNNSRWQQLYVPPLKTMLDSILSPPLDSINYWFLKKSINLYGEAFVKTIGLQITGEGSTDSGIAVIRDFWKNKGIQAAAIKMLDGSGLSPANRITTHALVAVMLYAKNQPWFLSFYSALPEINGVKMKDGYINSVRSYTGYVRSKKGAEYAFAFIVNNFDGSPVTAREKMWKVIDLLK